jgi:hypothetical protein
MSQFATPQQAQPSNQTTSYTVPSNIDFAPFLITAAANATLPSSGSLYGGQLNFKPGQGIVRVYNSSSSTANVTIVAASGDSLQGNVAVSPGTTVQCVSSGQGLWYITPFGTQSGSSGRQVAVVPITSANFLALHTTPLSLVATPGSGKCTIVEKIALKMVTTATAYASGGALEFRYTDGSGTKVSADIAAAVVTAGAGTSFTTVSGIEASLTGTANAAIVVTAASADFTTGTGTAICTVEYFVV